jgi:tRNA(Ile)-lysidine synthase
MEKSCWQMGIRPTYEQICTLVEFIADGKNGSELHLDNGVRAEKLTSSLRFTRPLPKGLLRGSAPPAAVIRQSIPGPGTYAVNGTGKELVVKVISAVAETGNLPGELRLDPARISFPLLLRSFQPGERFYPYGSPGRKKISRYLNERKIPAKERAAWPVLLSKDQIIALVGLQLDHNFRISSSTSRILSICWQDRQV